MFVLKWYANFKKKYIVQQRRPHEYIINRYYAHLIDPFLTKLAYDMKLSPNSITIIAGVMGIMASGFFATNKLVLGAIMLQLHYLLDCVDGNIARLTNRCTPLGAKLDKLVDQIVRATLFVSLAYLSTVTLWIKLLFLCTIYLDLYVVHSYVLPFLRKKQNYSLQSGKNGFFLKG
ncbi:hypothetical protein HMSSN036_23800 [Paenibacillus macerans]|nr:hypothetical protein HMSSN036_23800 [Paenibacillus macerans]